MAFAIEKHGFNKGQVNVTISSLQQEITERDHQIISLKQQLLKFQDAQTDMEEKNSNISLALTAAVEKAKQIEVSSRNVYTLKIQQMGLLYQRWESLLDELIEKYPDLAEVESVKNLLFDFKKSIENTLKEGYNLNQITSPIKSDNDPIRLLLSKVQSYSGDEKKIVKHASIARRHLSKDLLLGRTELEKLEEKEPLSTAHISKVDGVVNPVDTFLNSEPNEDKSVFALRIKGQNKTEENGFNLKEAVNPTDDLDQIMKSFDFYNGEAK